MTDAQLTMNQGKSYSFKFMETASDKEAARKAIAKRMQRVKIKLTSIRKLQPSHFILSGSFKRSDSHRSGFFLSGAGTRRSESSSRLQGRMESREGKPSAATALKTDENAKPQREMSDNPLQRRNDKDTGKRKAIVGNKDDLLKRRDSFFGIPRNTLE